jgi:hypothetical protein
MKQKPAALKQRTDDKSTNGMDRPRWPTSLPELPGVCCITVVATSLGCVLSSPEEPYRLTTSCRVPPRSARGTGDGERSRRRIHDRVTATGLSATQIGSARISIMARSRSSTRRPDTLAQGQPLISDASCDAWPVHTYGSPDRESQRRCRENPL